MNKSKRLRVGVIFGGRSSEHEVSLASARSIMAALDPDKYEVKPIGITRNGYWLFSGDPMKCLTNGSRGTLVDSATLIPVATTEAHIEPSRSPSKLGKLDVLIPMLHGPNGEDGTVQGMLELANIPYVGAGVMGSALAMDKAIMKDILRQHGIRTPESLVFRSSGLNDMDSISRLVGEQLGYPCFAKPVNMGSSVGISKVHDEEELPGALAEAAKYDRKIMVEQFIDGRELECSVLGNDDPVASVVGEIIPCNEFYDYHAKYIDPRSQLRVPADIPQAVSNRIRRIAIETFLASECWGMARVDFFLERNTNEIYVNELNTMPGFTAISMYPKLWDASGLPYPKLLDRLIELALEQHAERLRIQANLEAISPDRGGGVL